MAIYANLLQISSHYWALIQWLIFCQPLAHSPNNPPINQSINQSIDRSINQSINQPKNQQTTTNLFNHSLNRSITHKAKAKMKQKLSALININHPSLAKVLSKLNGHLAKVELTIHDLFAAMPCPVHTYPNSKVHVANMGPSGAPHVGHMNLAIWVHSHWIKL